MTAVIAVVIALSIGLIWWAKAHQPEDITTPETDVISLNGIHYHPKLNIFVKGEPVEIPQNIGLAGGHKPMHTHEDVPIIHLEYQGKVTKEDTRLGKFFEIWGKDFNSFGESVTMTVNGEPNTELENYLMKDADVIELRYE